MIIIYFFIPLYNNKSNNMSRKLGLLQYISDVVICIMSITNDDF